MAKQIVNIGQNANDGSGDGLRTGGDKINDNFNEIYSILGDGDNLLNTDVDFGPNRIFYSNLVSTESELSNINPSTYHGMTIHVHETGTLYYAHAGVWRKLLTDGSSENIPNYDDPLDAVAYSGNYNDLSNRPTIPSTLTDVGIVDGSAGQVLSTDGTGNFVFRNIEATSIDFANVTNKPTTLAGYGINDAFTGRYADLIDKPVLFSGNYDDLTNKPTIATDISGLTDTTNLLFDGDYSSLDNRPILPTDVSDLTDNTNLFFSRSYTDLTDKPTSFSSLNSISLALGVTVDEFSNDVNMTDNSATALVTERAVRSYVTNQVGGLSIPTDLTDLNISDGTSGQVLTTDGLGGFTFEDPAEGDQIGNFTLASSVIDTDDSSAITITPAVTMSSDLTVENDITVSNDVIVAGTVTASSFVSTGSGDPEFSSDTDITFSAADRVTISSSPFKLASFTTTERDLLIPENGDIIYNTTNNKFQGYENGAWANLI